MYIQGDLFKCDYSTTLIISKLFNFFENLNFIKFYVISKQYFLKKIKLWNNVDT